MNRTLRTAIQLIVALAAIVPTAVALLAEASISINGAALVAIAGVATLVVTAVQNALEQAGILRPVLKDDEG